MATRRSGTCWSRTPRLDNPDAQYEQRRALCPPNPVWLGGTLGGLPQHSRRLSLTMAPEPSSRLSPACASIGRWTRDLGDSGLSHHSVRVVQYPAGRSGYHGGHDHPDDPGLCRPRRPAAGHIWLDGPAGGGATGDGASGPGSAAGVPIASPVTEGLRGYLQQRRTHAAPHPPFGYARRCRPVWDHQL